MAARKSRKSSAVHPHIRGAYAAGRGRFPAPPVHPHIRGAYASRSAHILSSTGSSPHTWGIRWCPARCRRCLRVHPHIRGAYVPNAAISAASFGSSPHTWGIPVVVAPGIHKDRFIPTYVGHTLPLLPGSTPPSVHPHIRGAYRFDTGNTAQSPGSSPHTWGIHSIWQITAGPIWFIPTYVGHTHGPGQPFRPRLVHPHIRGAYIRLFRGKLIFNGSSPHTWGIRRK